MQKNEMGYPHGMWYPKMEVTVNNKTVELTPEEFLETEQGKDHLQQKPVQNPVQNPSSAGNATKTTIFETWENGTPTYTMDGDFESLAGAIGDGGIPDIYLRSGDTVMRCIEADFTIDDCITVCFISVILNSFELTKFKLMVHADGSVTEWMPL